MNGAVNSQLRRLAIFVTVALGLQVIWTTARVALVSEPEPIKPAASSLAVSEVAYPDSGAEAGEAIRGRPLFWEGRQPYVATDEQLEPDPGANEPDQTAIQGVRLLGVYGSGRSSGIIVGHRGKKLRLRINDEISGWQFTMMSADGAIFESGDEIKELALEHAVPQSKEKKASRTRRTGSKQPGGK